MAAAAAAKKIQLNNLDSNHAAGQKISSGNGKHLTLSKSLFVMDTDRIWSRYLSALQRHSVTVSKHVVPHRFPLSGLGLKAVSSLAVNTQIIHVPVDTLLKPSDIPKMFSATDPYGTREMRNHAAMACYLAFGPFQLPGWTRGPNVFEQTASAATSSTTLEQASKKRKSAAQQARKSEKPFALWQAWIDTWPEFENLTTGMPVAWPGKVNLDYHSPKQVPGAIAKENLKSAASKSRSEESNLEPPNSFPLLDHDTLAALAKQQAKFDKDHRNLKTALSHLPIFLTLHPSDTPSAYLTPCQNYFRLLHAWLLTNTRCFHYLLPGQRPPSDPDEAFALCPFIDLLNHSDGSAQTSNVTCDVTYSSTDGFSVTLKPTAISMSTSKAKQATCVAGEELFTTYGSHSSSTLWVEYGFLPPLGTNRHDYITIPIDIVQEHPGFTGDQIDLLKATGYWNDYSVRFEPSDFGEQPPTQAKKNATPRPPHGSWKPCYRTTLASYVHCLPEAEWLELTKYGLRNESHQHPETAAATVERKAKQILQHWLEILRSRVQCSLTGVQAMSSGEITDIFTSAAECEMFLRLKDETETGDAAVSRKRMEVGKIRHGMVISRWKQMDQVISSALEDLSPA